MNKLSHEINPQDANFDAIQTSAALLRSLSHDLRNPVSSIINASSFYLSGIDLLDDNRKTSLVQHIYDDSAHLLTMLENILVVSKLYDNAVPLSTNAEAVEEVMASAITRLKIKFPSALINARIPAKMLFIPMDSILIQQMLFSLLKILLTACGTRHPLDCTIIKKDSCALFYLNSPNPLKESSASSHDIDIAVCKLIIYAHKGSFSYSMQQDCSSFTVSLPLGGPL